MLNKIAKLDSKLVNAQQVVKPYSLVLYFPLGRNLLHLIDFLSIMLTLQRQGSSSSQ